MPKNLLAADLNHILDHTRDLWEELRGERIFITGGTGFFGCWLLESFAWANQHLNLNAQAFVSTRSPKIFQKKALHLAQNKNIQFVSGDLLDLEFPTGAFSHIIHAAAIQAGAQSPDFDFVEQFHANVSATQRVLEFARINGAKKFLFTSSGAVYGKQPPEISHIPETYRGAPDTTDVRSVYGQSKRASEYLCTAYAHQCGITATIARCFAFVGPYLPLDANYAIGNFIQAASCSRPIHINGDGTPYRSYLYAADLAIWLWTILIKGQACRPYNVGSENDVTIMQLAQEVAKELSPQSTIQTANQPVEGKLVERYVPSTQRARQELGLETWVSLKEAIHRTANFHSR